MDKVVTLRPIMSEKAYGLSSARTYMFAVPRSANKLTVKANVESRYAVAVTDVRMAILKGDKRRLYRRRKTIIGQNQNVKRAYVTLKEGDKLPIFESIQKEADKHNHDHDHNHVDEAKPKPKETAEAK